MTSKVSLLVVLLGAGLSSPSRAAKTRPGICYVNGANGMNPLFFTEVPRSLRSQYGIEWVALDIGARGDVRSRALKFQEAVNRLVAERPQFRCHLFAFSMGGLVARYTFAKARLKSGKNERKWNSLFPTFTTFATPHRGTPVADLISELFPSLEGQGLETLSERALKNPNDASHAEYWAPPAEMPMYSYRSYLSSREEAATFSYKFIYDFISKDSKLKGLDPRNDGMVPVRSQSFGLEIATLQVPHSYFNDDELLKPFFNLSAVDLFRRHWECLEFGHSDLSEEFQRAPYYESAGTSFCTREASSP